MKHSYYELLISRDKDNDLNSSEKQELEKHLEVCKSCKNFKSELNSISLALNLKLNIKNNSKIKLDFSEYSNENNKEVKDKKIINFNSIKNIVIGFAAVTIFAVGLTVIIKNKPDTLVKTKTIIDNNELNKLTEEKTNYDISMPLGGYLAYTLDKDVYDTIKVNSEKDIEELPMYSYFAYFDNEE